MILLEKPRCSTPLQVIESFVSKNPKYKDVKLAYAGRLDPQAEGLMLVLENEECLNRDEYQKLDKTYEFEILLGFSTDTGDIMGLVSNDLNKNIVSNGVSLNGNDDHPKLTQEFLQNFIGKQVQLYPAFSSKTFEGKKLFRWALEGKFPQVSHEINISDLRILEEFNIPSTELLEFIHKHISCVTGTFRQEEILALWQTVLTSKTNVHFPVYKIRADVTSGTYIRQLCIDIGKKLGVPALALSIKRVRVGTFDLAQAITLE